MLRIALPVKPTRRFIWTSATLISKNPASLLPQVQQFFDPKIGYRLPSQALFALSKNIPESILLEIVSFLQTKDSVGCLMEPFDSQNELCSIALSVYRSPSNALELVVPFRSSVPGKPKISLGREVKQAPTSAEDIHNSASNWSEVWQSNSVPDLPEDLKYLEPASVSQICYFTDDRPEGLTRALDAYFPAAQKLGLLATPTPFETGRPHTLLMNNSIYSDGAVGVAICRRPSSRSREQTAAKIDYGSLSPLGPTTTVIRSQGNIIIEVEGGAATPTLLKHIRSLHPQMSSTEGLDKGEEFYIGVSASPGKIVNLQPSECSFVAKIMSGSMSRGALSVNTDQSIAAGSTIQFFHRAKGAAIIATSRAFTFTTSNHGYGEERLADHFVARGSAFISGSPSWQCEIPGVIANIQL